MERSGYGGNAQIALCRNAYNSRHARQNHFGKMNVADAIRTASETLAGAGIAEPAKEARSLLAFALTREASFLIAHPEYELTDKEVADYESFVARRTSREPF